MARIFIQNPVTILADATHREAESREIRDEVLGLHETFRARLVRYVMCLGLKPSDAEDVAQETFLALFHHLLRGRPRTNLAGWLFRVAHRQALKKRAGYRSEAVEVEVEQAADAASPEDHVIFQQQHERLQRIFQHLPEADRLCLQLRSEGLKYREIANVLNISLGSVYNSLERSLNRLR